MVAMSATRLCWQVSYITQVNTGPVIIVMIMNNFLLQFFNPSAFAQVNTFPRGLPVTTATTEPQDDAVSCGLGIMWL